MELNNTTILLLFNCEEPYTTSKHEDASKQTYYFLKVLKQTAIQKCNFLQLSKKNLIKLIYKLQRRKQNLNTHMI